MVQRLPTSYVFDPADPRAPATPRVGEMLPDERARVVAMLDKVIIGQEELADRLAEEQRLREDAEQQLATALAEIERLKKGPT